MIPLSMAPMGLECVVDEIMAGRGMERRLNDMGFVKNARIKIVDTHHHSLIVEVNDCKYGICRGMANKIMVRDTDDNGKDKDDSGKMDERDNRE